MAGAVILSVWEEVYVVETQRCVLSFLIGCGRLMTSVASSKLGLGPRGTQTSRAKPCANFLFYGLRQARNTFGSVRWKE